MCLGLWYAFKQKMHVLRWSRLNKACHMTTLSRVTAITLCDPACTVNKKIYGRPDHRPRTQSLRTRVNELKPFTQNCFLFALPARMLLVCPAATHTPHHEAFKYNYRCFLQTRAKMLNPQTQASSHRCAPASALSSGRPRCRNCLNGRCCPARSLEHLPPPAVTSVFTSGA